MATNGSESIAATKSGALLGVACRFGKNPGSLAALLGFAGVAAAAQVVVDKLCGPGTALAAGATATAAAGAVLPAVTEFGQSMLGGVVAVAINQHSANTAAAEADAQSEHQRDFNFDLQLAVGRTLAKILRDWAADQPGALAEVAAAIAATAEARTKEGLPGWLQAADAVQVQIREEILRDLCLNRGRMPPGTAFLEPAQWTAFLSELLKSSDAPKAFGDYLRLWSTLASVLEDKVPEQFYNDIKAAFANPKHAKAWAAMQFRIQALMVDQISAAVNAAKAAESAGRDAKTAADAARVQSALTHEALLRLSSQLSVDMQALWQKLDERDQTALRGLHDEIVAKLDEMRRDIKTAADEATGGHREAKRGADAATEARDEVKGLRGDLKGRLRPDSPPSTVPTPSRTFIKREAITAKIHAALQANPERVVVRQAVARAMGGYGKTVAAILYADQYKDSYPGGRFFLPVESGDIAASLASLITPLRLSSANDPKADAALVSATLRDGEPSLLILDNIASRAAWEAMLNTGLVPRGNCRVLITTRDDKVAEKNDIAIGRLEPDEAREVYRLFCVDRRTDATHAAALPDPAIADAITAWVGGLAVAVAAVAAFMKLNPDISWEEHWLGDGKGMLGLKNMPAIELPDVLPEVAAQLGLEGKALEGHRRTLRVIDDAIKSLPAPERRAVDYAALLPPDMAPAAWLETLLETDAARGDGGTGDPADPLHLTLTKKPFSKASPARAILEHLDALDILLPGGEGGQLLSLHRLWHARLNERAEAEKVDRSPLWSAIAACATARRPIVVGVDQPGKVKAIDNPRCVTNAALRWELSPLISVASALAQAGRLKEAETVAWWLPNPLRLLGRLAEARTVLDALLKDPAAAQAALGDSGFATLLTNLAVIQLAHGELAGARASMERAIGIEEKHFAPDHPTFATRYSNLATIQQAQGDLPGARASIERAIVIAEKNLGAEHPNLATMRSNLAGIQHAQGDLPGARSSMERAIAIEQEHFSPDHLTFATRFNNLAQIAVAEGKIPEAVALWRKAHAICLKALGPDHRYTTSIAAALRHFDPTWP